MFPTLSEASQLITCKSQECQHNDNCFNPFQKLFVFVALLVMQRIQYTDEPLIGHCHIYNTTYMFSNIGIDIHKHIKREHVALGFPHRATRIHQLESMFEFLASAACRLALRVSSCRKVLPTENPSASRAFFDMLTFEQLVKHITILMIFFQISWSSGMGCSNKKRLLCQRLRK